MSDYMVEPKSRRELQILSRKVRRWLKIETMVKVPIVKLLDLLAVKRKDFNYEIVKDEEMPPGVHADTDVRTGNIRIRESVYNGAWEGNGRDRMTIAHEIAHFILLCLCGFKFSRCFSWRKVPVYRDPEWQAKCFAGEFMVSAELTRNMTPDQIAEKCGVSMQAAWYQYDCHRGGGAL